MPRPRRECRSLDGVAHYWCLGCKQWLPKHRFRANRHPAAKSHCGIRSRCGRCDDKAGGARRRQLSAAGRAKQGTPADPMAERTIEQVTEAWNRMSGQTLGSARVQQILAGALTKLRDGLIELKEAS